MKLLVKLRVTSLLIVILAIIYFTAKFVHIQERSLINYQQDLTQNIFNTLGSRNTSQYFQVNVDTSFTQPNFNSLKNTKPHQFYTVIIVMTVAENTDWRRTIRETWANWTEETNSIVLFFMCKPHTHNLINDLKEEALIYKDIIVDNLTEDPLMTTVKSLRMLNWYQMNFGDSSEFLVQTNDKMFINLFTLKDHLNSLTSEDIFNGFIGGKVYEKDSDRTPVFDDPYSPKFVPHVWWEGGLFPEFISPSFVVFSQRVIPYILEVSNNIPLFHIEAIYITGMLVKWTLRLDLTEIPHIYDEYSLTLDYFLWWTGELKCIISFQCNNRWRMMNLYTKALMMMPKTVNKIEAR